MEIELDVRFWPITAKFLNLSPSSLRLSQAANEMTWKPTPSIAAILGLFASSLSMLYVQRPGLAAVYFVVSALLATVTFLSIWAVGSEAVTVLLAVLGWVIPVVCAFHAYRIARDTVAGTERMWYSHWYALVGIASAVFVAVFVTRSFFYEPFRIPSESMYPTLPVDSMIFVEKLGFGHYGTYGITVWKKAPSEEVHRGDIVVHQLVDDPSTSFVTRVVALPGDHIRYVNHEMALNGRPVPLSIRHQDGGYVLATQRIGERDVEVVFTPDRVSRDFDQVVPPNHYAVFGDNRDNARDSRYIGFVPSENIVGRVVKVFRPRTS